MANACHRLVIVRGRVPMEDEMLCLNPTGSTHDGRAFHQVTEFSRIAGVIVAGKNLRSFRGEAVEVMASRLRVGGQEMLRQREDVLATLPKRQEMDRIDVQPVEQIATELLLS